MRQPVSLERGRACSLRVEIQRRRCSTTPGDAEESSRVARFSSGRRLVGGTRALSEQRCSSGRRPQETWGNARLLSSVCSQGKPPVLRECFAHSTALRRNARSTVMLSGTHLLSFTTAAPCATRRRETTASKRCSNYESMPTEGPIRRSLSVFSFFWKRRTSPCCNRRPRRGICRRQQRGIAMDV